MRRLRDTHDLMHVLSGYGRDALGEQCVLAFTYGQQPALAHLFLGYAGAMEISRRGRVKVPIFRAVREGHKMGKACSRLAEMPIRDVLAMPLDEARRMLGIRAARYYPEAHAKWRAADRPLRSAGGCPAGGLIAVQPQTMFHEAGLGERDPIAAMLARAFAVDPAMASSSPTPCARAGCRTCSGCSMPATRGRERSSRRKVAAPLRCGAGRAIESAVALETVAGSPALGRA
jgi:hypothetical protein